MLWWRVSVDIAAVVKGTWKRPEGLQRILLSSSQQLGDEPAGEECVCRLEPEDETRGPGRTLGCVCVCVCVCGGGGGGGGGLQTWECQLPDSSPCAMNVSQHLLFHYAKPPSPLK